jgi:hypothetical protein
MGDAGNGRWMVTKRVMAGCHSGNLPAIPASGRQLTTGAGQDADVATNAAPSVERKADSVPEYSTLGMAFASSADENFVLALAISPVRRASYLSRRRLAEKTLAGRKAAELRTLREIYSAENLLKERDNLKKRGDAIVEEVKSE